MSECKDGGPAFPAVAPNGDQYSGMTLRDYFAAKAMQGLLAAETPCNNQKLALIAYEVADAMLAERDK